MNTVIPALPVGATATELAVKVGVDKQIVVNLTKHTITVMDGVTPGGHELALSSELQEVLELAANANTKAQNALDTRVNKAGDGLTGSLVFARNSGAIIVSQNSDADRDDYYNATFYTDISFRDKNNKPIGALTNLCNATETYVHLVCYTGSGVPCAFGLTLPKDGNPFILGYEPPLTAVGREMVSASFLNKKLGSGASLAALANLAEPAEDYVETLETKKLEACAKLNTEASQAIYAGFPVEIDYGVYHIPYSLFDQINLADLAFLASRHSEESFILPCRTLSGNEVNLEVLSDTVIAVWEQGVHYKNEVLLAAREKKARIMAATTEEEIEAIYKE